MDHSPQPLIPEQVLEHFAERLGPGTAEVRLFFAPGRVNLLGAHLDYNGGYVLPGAIDRGTWLAMRPREGQYLQLVSSAASQAIRIDSEEIVQSGSGRRHGWADYPLGVIRSFLTSGHRFPGLDLFFAGDLPIGSGLSSSASLGMVTAIGLNALCGAGLSPEDLARITHHSENHHVGVRCGIMDPFACGLGRAKHLLFIDCKSEVVEHIPFDTGVASIAVTDTLLRRDLGDGRFNQRVRECRLAVEALRPAVAQLECLRDLDTDGLAEHAHLLSPALLRRARHVVSECQRCQAGARALRAGDYQLLGKLIEASHASSRDNYEVSCPELDFIVATGEQMDAVLGSRLTGAGFGGCVVSLVRRGTESAFAHEMSRRYGERFGRTPKIEIFSISGGAREHPHSSSRR